MLKFKSNYVKIDIYDAFVNFDTLIRRFRKPQL